MISLKIFLTFAIGFLVLAWIHQSTKSFVRNYEPHPAISILAFVCMAGMVCSGLAAVWML